MAMYNVNGSNTSSATPGTPTSATVGTTSASIGTAPGNGFSIFNTGTTNIFIAVAATPTTSLYTAKIPPGWHYEDPYKSVGAINAISSAAGGTANVTIYS